MAPIVSYKKIYYVTGSICYCPTVLSFMQRTDLIEKISLGHFSFENQGFRGTANIKGKTHVYLTPQKSIHFFLSSQCKLLLCCA